MYSDILVESIVRQRQREINQHIEQQQLLRLARQGRGVKRQRLNVREWARRVMSVFFPRSRPVASDDCA
jgi:hypothetical protein